MAALCVAAVLLVAPGAALGAAPTIYVDDSDAYSVAFKGEEDRLYALELDGTADCYFTEPHEDAGSTSFSAFPAPTLLRGQSERLVAEDVADFGPFASARSRVAASLGEDAVTGTFSFDESEETFHCDTGYEGVPFVAGRYEPIGTPGAAAPASGEVGAYYGAGRRIEVFMRARHGLLVTRGSFVPRCPVGRRERVPDRRPLVGGPALARLHSDGSFGGRIETSGKTRTGVRFKETLMMAGRVGEEAVTGRYARLRTVFPPHRPPRRCKTGPLRFRAPRYVPAA